LFLMAAQRQPIVAGNWKMNTTLPEALALVDAMLPRLNDLQGVERVVCPPFISLAAVAERLRGTGIGVGAQNIHPEPKGAFTGEIAIPMLLDLGVRYVILGHSERRQYFFEDDAFINRKVRAVQAVGLVPIVCVGETLEQNEAGQTEEVVSRQTRALLEGNDPGNLVIAYEPIWAIGTGRAATAEGANATIGIIRRVIREAVGEAAQTLRIQYGGSVTPDNCAAIMAQPEIDGALVGGASLRAEQFVEIVRLSAPRTAAQAG
jgi:triosephosphate isomerase (TIM)